MNLVTSVLSDFLDVPPFVWLCDAMWGPGVQFGVDGNVVVKSDVQLLLDKHKIKSWAYCYMDGGDDIVSGLMRKAANALVNRLAPAGEGEPGEQPAVEEGPQQENPPPEQEQGEEPQSVNTLHMPSQMSMRELLFKVPKKKARWTRAVLQMNNYPITRLPEIARRKRYGKKWRL